MTPVEPTPFLRPTALQQIRGFLAESGAALPPWSSSDEAMDELVALLHERRGDDAFYARLSPFLEELRSSAIRGESGLAARDAELLGRSTVESIVAELRDGLRRAPAGAAPSLLKSLIGERAAPLLCLALFSSGLSACTQPASPSAQTSPSEPGVPGAPTPTPTPPAAQSGSTDALVDMFKNKSPEEVAKELERAVDAGRSPPEDFNRKRKAIQNFGDNSVALYKGVNLA